MIVMSSSTGAVTFGDFGAFVPGGFGAFGVGGFATFDTLGGDGLGGFTASGLGSGLDSGLVSGAFTTGLGTSPGIFANDTTILADPPLVLVRVADRCPSSRT